MKYIKKEGKEYLNQSYQWKKDQDEMGKRQHPNDNDNLISMMEVQGVYEIFQLELE